MKTFLIVSLAWLFFWMFIFPLFLTKKERRKMDEDARKKLKKKKAFWHNLFFGDNFRSSGYYY